MVWSPVHDAARDGNVEEIKRLIAQGYDADERDWFNKSPFHVATFNGKLDVVKYLAEECQVDVHAVNVDGWSALHFSAYYGFLHVAEYLVAKWNLNIDAQHNGGHRHTALMCAAENGHMNVVEFLVAAGANVKIKNKVRQTAIQVAKTDEIRDYLTNVSEDPEGGMAMTKSAAFKSGSD